MRKRRVRRYIFLTPELAKAWQEWEEKRVIADRIAYAILARPNSSNELLWQQLLAPARSASIAREKLEELIIAAGLRIPGPLALQEGSLLIWYETKNPT